jgi:hypothetical protein
VSWGISIQQFHVAVRDAVPFEGDLHDYTAEYLRDSDLKDGWLSHKVKA